MTSRIRIERTFDAYPKGAKETFAAGRTLRVGEDVDPASAAQWVAKGLAHRLAGKIGAKEKDSKE